MALIVCSECGKEFSDKAPACPNCGCPTDCIVESAEEGNGQENVVKSEYEKLNLEYYAQKYGSELMSAVDELVKKEKISAPEAFDIFVEYYSHMGYSLDDPLVKITAKLYKKSLPSGQGENETFRGLMKEAWQQSWQQAKGESKESINTKRAEEKKLKKEAEQEYKRNKALNIAMCPKCHSTSITYTDKKLSLGRAIVGNALAGGVGAVLGGQSSKKGKCKCLKCGHTWKI